MEDTPVIDAFFPHSPAEAGDQPSSPRSVLEISNGYAAPLDAVPCLSFSEFEQWLTGGLKARARVAAFFAVPEERFAGASPSGADAEPACLLYAVLADYAANRLCVASTLVRGSYPSLSGKIPQLHLFEREIYEKNGVTPEGHPWLKPVRFSRAGGPEIGNMSFFRVNGDEVHEVAVGPIHAGVIECGHFRFQCLGELVMHLEISLGYHHRGLEEHLCGAPDAKKLALMEALAGDSSIAHSWAYCSIVEALCDMAPSPRGQLIRFLALELERLANHTGDLGALAGDVGFLPTMSYCGRLRGDWLNMSALLSGSRFGRGLLCVGGVRFDPRASILKTLKKRVEEAERDVLGAVKLMWDSPSAMARFAGIGALSGDDALEIGAVGLAARASGLDRDVRHSHPLPLLPHPPDSKRARHGDVLARAFVRYKEIPESAGLCKRLVGNFLDDMEEGHDSRVAAASPLAPDSIAVALVEGWRGEVCHVALTGPSGDIHSYTVVDPSFHNWMGLAIAMRGQQISDFPICNKSFNLSYCGHDL